MTRWTQRQIDHLCELWAAGYTSGQIARKFKVTRNVILGRLNYLGLLGKMTPEERRERARKKPTPISSTSHAA